MLDIHATWSRSLCSGPSGSRRNPLPSNVAGGAKSTGTNGRAMRTIYEQPGNRCMRLKHYGDSGNVVETPASSSASLEGQRPVDAALLVAYTGTVAVLTLTPGPSTMLGSAHGMRYGAKGTLPTIAGDLSANILHRPVSRSLGSRAPRSGGGRVARTRRFPPRDGNRHCRTVCQPQDGD